MVEKTSEEYIKKIQKMQGWFIEKKFFQTANWLGHIQKMMSEKEPSDYFKDFMEVLIQHKNEVEKQGEYYYKIYQIVWGIYSHALNRGVREFHDYLLELTPYIEEFFKTSQNLFNLSDLTRRPDLDIKSRYYLGCYLYLVAVEGAYWSFIKFLYSLIYFGNHDKKTIQEIDDLKLYELKRDFLNKFSDTDILFTNWFDGGLRNAIAHADMKYIQENDTMEFTHYYRGKLKFQKTLTYSEFYNIFRELYSVIEMCYEFIMLLRLRDLCINFSRKIRK